MRWRWWAGLTRDQRIASVGVGVVAVGVVLAWFPAASLLHLPPFGRGDGQPSPTATSTGTSPTPAPTTTGPLFLASVPYTDGTKPDSQGPAAVTVNGQALPNTIAYQTSFSTVSTSWTLGGSYSHFSATVAVGRCQISCSDNTTLFQVKAGGQTVISQQVQDGQDIAVSQSFPPTQQITLVMSFVKTFPGEGWWYWGNVELTP